mgnify:CR=1 FL=1
MATLTKAARMAWEIGAAEAARLRHPFIEREHLLIGLCSLPKILQYLDYTHIESLPVDPVADPFPLQILRQPGRAAPGHRFDAADTRSDGRLARDAKRSDAAHPVEMRSAAELHADIADPQCLTV